MNGGWIKLAQAVLRDWIMSGDPLHGEPWHLWCAVAGVDPWEFRRTANDLRKREGIE